MIRRPVRFRPVIGISGYCEQARWNQWDLPAVLLPRNYTDQVAACGGRAGVGAAVGPEAGGVGRRAGPGS